MIAKRIRCVVPQEARQAFSDGQRAWRRLAALDGFVLQVGGWADEVAVILALWREERAYRAFMEHEHDVIADAAGQAHAYSSIDTRVAPFRLDGRRVRDIGTGTFLDVCEDEIGIWVGVATAGKDATRVQIEPAWDVRSTSRV